MNTTNCTVPGWAHDDLVFSLRDQEESCTLNIVFFNTYVSFLVLLQCVNLVIRTQYVLHRARKTKRALGRHQYVTIGSTLITLIAIILFLVLPNTIGAGRNTSVCLVNITLLMFNFSLLRWVEKIMRLGSRLIMKRLPEAKSLSASRLLQRDNFVTGMLAVSYVLCLFMFITGCVLSIVLYEQRVWPHVALGLMGSFLIIASTCSVYQTEKCRRVISDTAKRVKSVLTPSVYGKYDKVQSKFRSQQILVFTLGFVGSVVCLLGAANVFAIDHIMLLTAITFDAVGTIFMLGSVAVSRCTLSTKSRITSENQAEDELNREGNSPSKFQSKLMMTPTVMDTNLVISQLN